MTLGTTKPMKCFLCPMKMKLSLCIGGLICTLWVLKNPKLLYVDCKNAHQTVWIHRLTLIFTCCCVGVLQPFGCDQLTYPHCSWPSLLGSLPVLSAHSFTIFYWQLPFLNQRKGENGRRNYFMTTLHERTWPISTKDCTRNHPHTRRTCIQLSYHAHLIFTYEPQHDKTNKMTCVSTENSISNFRGVRCTFSFLYYLQ